MTAIRFGVPERKSLTGAELAIRAFQVFSLLPIPYVLAIVGYPAISTTDNILSVLFGIGFASLPRAEALLLSACYRASLSEVTVIAILLLVVLVCGIVFRRLLARDDGSAVPLRRVYAVWIAVDLVLRLIPLPFNLAFGIVAQLIGFCLRLACLALVVLDLRAMGDRSRQ